MRARLLAILLVPLLLSEGCAIPEGIVPLINSFLNRRNNNAPAATRPAQPATTNVGTITAPAAGGTGIAGQQPAALPQRQSVTGGSGIGP